MWLVPDWLLGGLNNEIYTKALITVMAWSEALEIRPEHKPELPVAAEMLCA